MSLLNKYINSSDFLTATSVYDDSNLLTVSADGYYQFGGNYRQQLSGVLGPLVLCETCIPPAIPCGSGVNPPSGNQGLYNLTFDSGDTVSDVGAIVIYFNPQSVPDGIRVLYDSVYYNSVSSPTSGRIQSTSGVADAFTLLGNSSACVPALPNTTSYNYFDGFTGSSWNAGTPTPQNITLNTGDDQYGGASEYSTLVIPKTSATPSDVSVQVLGPCSGTAWTVEVDCPITLPSFTASANIGSSINCTAASVTYYFAKHRGAVNTIPVLTSWVFSDSNGSTALTNGNYVLSNNNVITVTNGVVTSVVTCTGGGTLTPFYATPGISEQKEGTCNVVCNTLLYHNGTGTLPQVGDTIYAGSTTGSQTVEWSDHRGFGNSNGDNAYVTGTAPAQGVVASTWQCQ